MYSAVVPSIEPAHAVIAAPERPDIHARSSVEVFAAGHPAPNSDSVAAGERALALAERSRPEGGLLVLLSGGASAMLAAPAFGVSLQEKLATARALMEAGAAIHELNCVRKHLSRIKGGRLTAAAGRTVTLALSDVHAPVADDPSVIGSGPTVADPTTFAEALAIVRARDARVPPAVAAYLERGARGEVPETPKPGDPRVASSTYTVIGNRQTAVEGVRSAADARGYRVIVFPEATTGEARDAGVAFVSAARSLAADADQPLCIVASGETTVTVRGDGIGGRNQELALAAACSIEAAATRPMHGGRSWVLGSAGTDGIDGPTDAAGAVVDPTTLARAADRGLDWTSALARNDVYRFFEPLDDLIRWGPTGTNVGDLHVMLIG